MHRQSSRPQTSDEERPAGVIDCLGMAFALLNDRPYLILPPVLLDLYFWLGLRLSVRSVTEPLERWSRAHAGSEADFVNQIHGVGQNYNLFELLGVGIPSMVRNLGSGGHAGIEPRWILGAQAWWLIPAGVALLLLGGLVGITYVTLIGSLVRPSGEPGAGIVSRIVRNYGHLLGFVCAVAGIVVLLMLPLAVLSGVMLAIGIDVLPLSALLIMVVAVVLYVLLYFGQDAIVVSDAGPLRAIYLSYNVVRRNAWGTIGFITVTSLIGSGVPVALSLFTHSPWSMPFALIGHAYIATGMVAASMLFYRDRARSLAPAIGSDLRPSAAAIERP